MKKRDAGAELKLLITEKEAECQNEMILLKEHLHTIAGKLKPANLIKNGLHEMISPLKNTVINTGIGITSGVIAKKIFNIGSPGILRKLGGIVLETIVRNKATKNADQIKSAGKSIGNRILKKIFEKRSDLESS